MSNGIEIGPTVSGGGGLSGRHGRGIVVPAKQTDGIKTSKAIKIRKALFNLNIAVSKPVAPIKVYRMFQNTTFREYYHATRLKVN